MHGRHGACFAAGFPMWIYHNDHCYVFEFFNEKPGAHFDIVFAGDVAEELQLYLFANHPDFAASTSARFHPVGTGIVVAAFSALLKNCGAQGLIVFTHTAHYGLSMNTNQTLKNTTTLKRLPMSRFYKKNIGPVWNFGKIRFSPLKNGVPGFAVFESFVYRNLGHSSQCSRYPRPRLCCL